MITFLLNDTECKPALCDPHQSVLDFLRKKLQQKGKKVTAQLSSKFIESIIVPKPDSGYVLRSYKISKRLEDDISATCTAFYVKIADGVVIDARIAFGGMAAMPARAKHCEQALIGSHWQQLNALASDAPQDSDQTNKIAMENQ